MKARFEGEEQILWWIDRWTAMDLPLSMCVMSMPTKRFATVTVILQAPHDGRAASVVSLESQNGILAGRKNGGAWLQGDELKAMLAEIELTFLAIAGAAAE